VIEIPLTQNRVALVDDEDFDRVAQFKWWASENRRAHQWYAARGFYAGGKRHTVLMHRFILDAPRGVLVDHKDRDGLNNTRGNLRLCDHSLNAANAVRRLSASGYRNVYAMGNTGRWMVRLTIRLKQQTFGIFDDLTEAAHFADQVAIQHFGDFAILNFPPNGRVQENING
jgi:hypothetical protein